MSPAVSHAIDNLPAGGGILFCLSQSALFSGLKLAVFSLGRLELEVEAAGGDPDAAKLLALRQMSNQYLCTILWGNVGINVLLTLLSDSVMAGATAFVFSTVFITVLGEIVPQAHFSRNALRMGAALSPLLRAYRLLLFPVVFPSALLLEWWLGEESIRYWREREIKEILLRHMQDEGTDLGRTETLGALTFMNLDDLMVMKEGVPVDPESILAPPVETGRPRAAACGSRRGRGLAGQLRHQPGVVRPATLDHRRRPAREPPPRKRETRGDRCGETLIFLRRESNGAPRWLAPSIRRPD